MANKVGRNEKCPCGSGRKYKNCCLKQGIDFLGMPKRASKQKEFSFGEYFQNFHSIDLLATLAALSIYPLNHGKNLRLDYLILEALKADNEKGKTPVLHNELEKVLADYLPHHHLEDPPTNLFTGNVASSLGNNIIYGGNFEHGIFILNTIVGAIQFNIERLPKPFIELTNDALNLLLTISNLIASRVGHSRNMEGEYESAKSEIQFPSDIESYKDALFFSNSWLTEFCENLKIDQSILAYFCLEFEEVESAENDIGDSNNPLITKPVIKLTNGLLIVAPTNIISALIHFVWVLSEKLECKGQLIKYYHKIVWHDLFFFGHRIGFEPEIFEFIRDVGIPLKNALFRIDKDKLLYLSFILDNGEDYDNKSPCHPDPNPMNPKIAELQNLNFQKIKEHYKNENIIDLTLYSSIGREYMLMAARRDDAHVLITSAFSFLCWIQSGGHDHITLWYFLEALRKFEEKIPFGFPTDFLNYYSFFSEKSFSFYLGDSELPTGFTLLPGGELGIIKKAVDEEDRIVVYYKTDDIPFPVLAPVIKFGNYIPRYFNPENLGKQLEYYLPGYSIDIWLRTKNRASEIPKKEFDLYWEMSEAISYWFWQIADLLDEYLKQLKLPVLLIQFDILNSELFDNEELLGQRDASVNDKFEIKVENDKILFGIPGEIMGFLSYPDNEGERIIIKKLLEGLGLLLGEHNVKNSLTDERIDEIIELKAPLGLKKMLLFIHSRNEIALDPRNIVKPRYIQESRRQWFMDIIVSLLGDDCPPVGEIKSKEDKERLTRKVVNILLEELKNHLKDYNSKELLLKVMENYESILHENALSRLRTPTRLKCFAEQENIVEEIQKQTHLVDETTLVCRCLIEHLAAEATFGKKQITLQAIDDSLALMSLIIWWGGVGDQITYELYNVELAILPSGRIGTNSKEISESFFKSFSETKAKEFIDDSLEGFSALFIKEEVKNNPTPKGFEQAFVNEFGIGFSKLGGIMDLLIHLGFEQNENVAKVSINELKEIVKEFFDEKYTENEINSAIDFLILWNRGDVKKCPTGFLNTDISPWRYNRKLSYLQRPLILIDYGEEANDPHIYWTPRHVEHSWKYLNYLVLSARYKAKDNGVLKQQISKISKDRGAVLQKAVVEWLVQNANTKLDEEVTIAPKGKLKHPTDLGDIDILVIDDDNKILLSIECKRTEQARNSKEMVEQVQQYYGSGSEKGYFQRHIDRGKWLISNLKQVSEFYKSDLTQYKVISFFITYEILAIQFMSNRKLPLPMLSLYELKQMSYEDLIKFLS